MIQLLLEVKSLDVCYQEKQVVFGALLHVQVGEFVALIGHNGAGKTTLLKAICGFLKPSNGEVIYKGKNITGLSPAVNVKEGLCFVQQEKSIFPNLSVLENLQLAAYAVEKTSGLNERLEKVYSLFPVLKDREKQLADTLSGGQQKQLAVGMAILMQPELLLLDEPTLGLSPNLVKDLGGVLEEISKMGTAILLVEQNVKMAISLAERVYVMRTGQIILEDTHAHMITRENLWDLF
ncbi:MAG: ABC transporter ATP-binding protein [Deltaproteobacteria bacterium]|nr:ABC transporter ATP-binding protein [Deltaproteobacteria bacterium]